jgi:hypothetical protein
MITKNKPCIVLSPARTGSTFLAEYIANKFFNGVDVVKGEAVEQQLVTGEPFVGSSHALLDPYQLTKFTPVYSFRESIIDSVISRVIATHFEIWEPSELSFKERTKTPFVADLNEVAGALIQQMDWYTYYGPLLTPASHVVAYEVFTKLLPNNYFETVNKSSTIINYQEVIAHINDNLTEEVKLIHGEFVDWKCRPGCQTIYRILQN